MTYYSMRVSESNYIILFLTQCKFLKYLALTKLTFENFHIDSEKIIKKLASSINFDASEKLVRMMLSGKPKNTLQCKWLSQPVISLEWAAPSQHPAAPLDIQGPHVFILAKGIRYENEKCLEIYEIRWLKIKYEEIQFQWIMIPRKRI